MGLDTTKSINGILKKANYLFKESDIEEQIEHTDEVLLDAKLFATTTTTLYNVTSSMEIIVDSYEPEDFGARLVSLY